MLYTFIIYNTCFFIALCVVGVSPSVSSLLSCSPECFGPFRLVLTHDVSGLPDLIKSVSRLCYRL
jgi:hypothetical protein